VAVRQIVPGWRMRIPVTFPPSPYLQQFREAAMTEAAAHAFFDLTQESRAEMSCAEVATWLARYTQGGSP
jgi:hypothetical protein